MTQAASIVSIEKATSRSWQEWLEFLTNESETPHAEIARSVAVELEGVVDNPGWWAQHITVAYEQHIGRRQPGQRADGTFEVAVSRTMSGNRDEVFARVLDWVGSKNAFHGHRWKNARTSTTPVRSYWRSDLENDSKLEIAVGPGSGTNFMVTISHIRLQSGEEASVWRSYWKQEIVNI